MKNNTAMEELIEYITKYQEGLGGASLFIKDKAIELLEKEERQLEFAFNTGKKGKIGFSTLTPAFEDYYSQTFKKD